MNTKVVALRNLCEAASLGDIEAAREALSQGASVNGRVEYGKTPVMFAIQNAHVPMISFLKSAGARLNMLDEDGEHPMIYIFNHNEYSVSKDGTKKEITPDMQMEVLRTLVLLGADKEARGEFGKPALHYAARRFDGEQIHALLDLGMSPLSVESLGNSTFLYALAGNTTLSDRKATQFVQICIDAGVDINARSSDGETALAYAKRRGSSSVANALLAAGATEDALPSSKKRAGPR